MELEISLIRKVEFIYDFKILIVCEVFSCFLVEYYIFDIRFVESDGRGGFFVKIFCNVDNKNLLIL